MARLIYSPISSLDGYVEDEQGHFHWAAPDREVHAFLNELERPIGTYLYGRRMYETMRFWETAGTDPAQPAEGREFAQIWQSAEKIVYSRSLEQVSSAKTRIERDFNADAVRRCKRVASSDLTIGGPELAGQAIRAGLVDELQLFLVPVLVGGGKPALPARVHGQLELIHERRFASGVVHLHYRFRA